MEELEAIKSPGWRMRRRDHCLFRREKLLRVGSVVRQLIVLVYNLGSLTLI